MKPEPLTWRSRYPSDVSAKHAASTLPGDMLLADAGRQATPQRPYLVITERGQCAVVPTVLPGMQKIAVEVDGDDDAEREAV